MTFPLEQGEVKCFIKDTMVKVHESSLEGFEPPAFQFLATRLHYTHTSVLRMNSLRINCAY